MQFLFVAEEKVSTSKTAFADWALERLFLCMRPLVALEVLEPRERAGAGGTNIWPGFISFNNQGLGRDRFSGHDTRLLDRHHVW